MIATLTCHLPVHTPHGPVGAVLPQGTPDSPSGGGVAHSGSSRTLGSPCMNAFSPSANVPSDVVDARICCVMLMDDSPGVGQLRSISWMSGSLEGLVPSVCLLPAKDKARGDNAFTLPFSDRHSLRGIYDCHSLEIEYSLPFGSDCFRKLRLLFGRKVFPGYLVGVPSTEVKILHAVCSPRRTQSKRFRVAGFFRR